MAIERAYRPDGLPAYVIVKQPGKTGTGQATSLVYPRAQNFQKLWDRGFGSTKVLVIPETRTE